MSMGVTRFSVLECITNQNCVYFGFFDSTMPGTKQLCIPKTSSSFVWDARTCC